MSTQSQVTLNGFGPHVRFRTNSINGTVKVVTSKDVKTVSLDKTTDLKFSTAAA